LVKLNVKLPLALPGGQAARLGLGVGPEPRALGLKAGGSFEGLVLSVMSEVAEDKLLE